jgi:hypothetical protein
MNWKKLPKEKRQQLILVVLVTLVVLGGLGFGLIKHQYENLTALANKQVAARLDLKKIEDAIKHASQIQTDLETESRVLAIQEAGMATGDLYLWAINTLKKFKSPYKIDMPLVSPPSAPSEGNLIPRFPYKQATLTVGGTAYYHDLGRFIADLENEFPHLRVANLNLELNPSPLPGEREKLSFKMDIVTLIKLNNQ